VIYKSTSRGIHNLLRDGAGKLMRDIAAGNGGASFTSIRGIGVSIAHFKFRSDANTDFSVRFHSARKISIGLTLVALLAGR
jgi:hypothetical protein